MFDPSAHRANLQLRQMLQEEYEDNVKNNRPDVESVLPIPHYYVYWDSRLHHPE